MTQVLRKLNDEGVRRFAEYLASGAEGDVPLVLLQSPETSDPVFPPIIAGVRAFDIRFDFGVYLNKLLNAFDPGRISSDRNLWTSLALLWFDHICPKQEDGTRDVKEQYRYILSSDYRHYYRHLVRSPWHLVRVHGQNARFLLTAPQQKDHPLSVHGEILEQFGGRQQVLASKPIIAAANKMYLDPKSMRPRKGVAGSGRGSARRFGIVLRQFDLTYDPEVMPDTGLIDILPVEFDHWKKHLAKAETRDTPAGKSTELATPP